MENLEPNNLFEALLTPNGAPTTLRAHVVKILSAGILSGKYRPGDRLNESQIARELNISRIPVREALSQLQEQGLVQNRERRGSFVTNISPEEVLQISSAHRPRTERCAAKNMTPDTLGAGNLVAQWSLERHLAGSGRPGQGIRRVLWKMAGNPHLERALNLDGSLVRP